RPTASTGRGCSSRHRRYCGCVHCREFFEWCVVEPGADRGENERVGLVVPCDLDVGVAADYRGEYSVLGGVPLACRVLLDRAGCDDDDVDAQVGERGSKHPPQATPLVRGAPGGTVG